MGADEGGVWPQIRHVFGAGNALDAAMKLGAPVPADRLGAPAAPAEWLGLPGSDCDLGSTLDDSSGSWKSRKVREKQFS